MSSTIRLIMTLLIWVFLLSACALISAPEPTGTPEPPDKILFVGNSFTFWNQGVDYHMELLAASANPPWVIEAESIVKGGAALKTMWEYTKAPNLIGEGDYDVVVLQEDIPETDVDTFHEYARKFVKEIKKTGAEPVLFMAWSYERLGWITMEEIARAHRDIATELGVDVAPVGLAWQRAMKERPDLDMYGSDREHPSIYGTCLTLYVLYATIFGQSPVGLSYQFADKIDRDSVEQERKQWDITKDEVAFLQRIAWEAVQEYQAQQ